MHLHGCCCFHFAIFFVVVCSSEIARPRNERMNEYVRYTLENFWGKKGMSRNGTQNKQRMHR